VGREVKRGGREKGETSKKVIDPVLSFAEF
jgi:hypothetical protein